MQEMVWTSPSLMIPKGSRPIMAMVEADLYRTKKGEAHEQDYADWY